MEIVYGVILLEDWYYAKGVQIQSPRLPQYSFVLFYFEIFAKYDISKMYIREYFF